MASMKRRIVPRDPHRLVDDPEFQAMFEAFSCNVPNGSPATPDILTPDITFTRWFRTIDIEMPDTNIVEFWGFSSPENTLGAFPSDTIRLTQGQIFHCKLEQLKKGTHTIHWHGIEPTAMNDGVGKLSFEVSGEYTYQWYASSAGTYFYHCHHNTVLHFEMGMYGMLIIDPPDDPGDPPGTKRAFTNGPIYDVEAIWVSDDVDPVWHSDIAGTHGHDAGIACPFGMDMGLHNFNPQYFLITGVPHPWSQNLPTDLTHPGVAVTVNTGQTLLVRLLCAGYCVHRYTIEGLDAEVIAMDGRPMGQLPYTKYCQSFIINAGQSFELTAARRYDLIIKPTGSDVGSHKVTVEFFDLNNGSFLGKAETFIHVV